jgi:hypothetical protein
MKHLEPLPKTIVSKQDLRSKPSRPSVLKLFLAGTALVVGLGYGISSLWGAYFTDNISEAKKAELVAGYTQMKAVSVDRVSEQEIEKALDTMRLLPDQRQQLRTKASEQSAKTSPEAGTAGDESSLVWITVWDFASADGDVVHISSAGYETNVTLLKVQTRIAVPVDASKTVKITGMHDGGGGITLGVKSGASPISLPVLGTGQTLTLAVSY